MSPSTPSTSWCWRWSPARVIENVEEVVAEVKDRLGVQPPALMTSDEYAVYETVIATTFSEVVDETPTGPCRRPILPEREPAPGLIYATVHKERNKDFLSLRWA